MLIFFLILEEIFSKVEHDVYCGLVTYSLYYVMYVPSILSFLRVFIRNGFLGDSDSKESACNEGDPGSPGLGRSPGEGNGYPHSSTLAWRTARTEEPGRLQPMGLQRVGHD